jgi:hypothetical protein
MNIIHMDTNGTMVVQEPIIKENGDFYYNTYEKVTTWRKNVYHISAKTKEEADNVMKQYFQDNELHTGCENPNDLNLIPHWCDHGDYYEGDEDIVTYEDNGFRPTEELYDDEGNLIDDNTPIQIKRDKKINLLFKTTE